MIDLKERKRLHLVVKVGETCFEEETWKLKVGPEIVDHSFWENDL